MLKQLPINFAFNYSHSVTLSGSHTGAGLILALVITGIVLYVLLVIALWKVFVKAGRPGWPAIIPIYNNWVLFEIAGKPGWWALIGLAGAIPILGIFAGIVSLVLYVIVALELAKRFGKSTTFAVVGLIIFSIVGLLILGFGKDKYQATPAEARTSPPEPKTPPAPLPPTASTPEPPQTTQ